MAITYVATLTCGRCKATLRFENERPDWKTYDYRVEQADECERSARFVAEHADTPIPPPNEIWPAYAESGRPRFVFGTDAYTGSRLDRVILSIPDPYRYVDCPVCDERVKEPK